MIKEPVELKNANISDLFLIKLYDNAILIEITDDNKIIVIDDKTCEVCKYNLEKSYILENSTVYTIKEAVEDKIIEIYKKVSTKEIN